MVDVADDLLKSETLQGKVTGLIYPPPDVRAVIDKTAQFVARNGRDFERKIAGETSNNKFAFLRQSDPYHAYYEMKIQEIISTPETPAVAKKEDFEQAPPPPTKANEIQMEESSVVIKAPVEAPVARAAKSMPKKAPLPEEFKLIHPQLSAVDNDIIKLTAQYTAVSGKPFLSGLATREQRNPQFDFLKPTHALFAYFTALVDGYSKILSSDLSSDVNKRLVDGLGRLNVLDRCVHRLEWARIEEEKKKKAQAEEDAERVAFQQIDWHDFIVVETITFNENEVEEEETPVDVANEDDMDMDMDDDEDRKEDHEYINNVEQDEEVKTSSSSQIKVVHDYVPEAHRSNMAGSNTKLMTADGKTVSTEEINEHMRILLMDPKWREENQRRLDKQKESSFAGGQAIAESLKRFADRRSDIFASSEEEEVALLRRSSTQENQKVIWDGHQASVQATQQAAMDLPHQPPQEQIYNNPHEIGPSNPHQFDNQNSLMGMQPPSQIRPPYGMPLPQHPYGMGRGYMMPPQAPGILGMGGNNPNTMPPGMGIMGMAPNMPIPPNMPMPPNMSIPQGISHMIPNSGMHVPPGIPGMEEPLSKRAKTDSLALIPEEEFAATHKGPIRLLIAVPKDPTNSQWKLNGQILPVTCDVKSTLKEVKEQIAAALDGMPVNKQQLKAVNVGFVKDTLSLAHYNMRNGTRLELSVRQRGGRR